MSVQEAHNIVQKSGSPLKFSMLDDFTMENSNGLAIKGCELGKHFSASNVGAVCQTRQSVVGCEITIKISLAGFTSQSELIRQFDTEVPVIEVTLSPRESEQSDLDVRLFGQFQVMWAGEAVTGFSSDKVRALLAYLVCDASRPHRRETLATLLWPERPDEIARNNLRRALSDLRQAIRDDQADPPYLLITRQSIQWNPENHARVDVLAFSQVPETVQVNGENITTLKKLANLYQGEFLEGFSLPDSIPFHEWALLRREQLARQAIELLSAIANYYEKNRAFEEALPHAWRLVELNPWDEGGQRQLLRLLAYTGQRGAALAQYEKLASDLDGSLGVAPESATTELYGLIKNNQIENGVIPVFTGQRMNLQPANQVV